MRKSLFSLVGAGLALLLIFQACGGSDTPPVPPRADGGSWVICEGTDAGVCAPGESCVFVELYDRALCVRPCGTGCEDPGQLCCEGSEDGGTGGYCMPREVCEPPDAGTDGGTEPNAPQDGGSDAGTNPNPGTDAGTNPGTDAGTNPNPGTDAGTSSDAGTTPGTDAGTNPGTDAGTNPGTDAGTNPGTDAGTNPGTDAGTNPGTDAGTNPGTDAGTPPTFARVRIMASNLTSGNFQSYDLGHGNRLMQGVSPDVILLQEFNYGDNSATTMRDYVTNIFGASFHYYQEPSAQIPNGIISRWPIIASGEWDDPRVSNRDFAWARIDIPGPKDLWAISVHLLTANATERNAEASSLVGFINANIPQGDYLVIGGDLNTDNRSESCFSTFSQVVTTGAPYPADQNGNGNTNASRAKPYDHVLVDGDLRQYQIPTVIGLSTYTNGLVLDSRVYTPISEIAPAQVGDSAASMMQHMGVIKDFRVPAN